MSDDDESPLTEKASLFPSSPTPTPTATPPSTDSMSDNRTSSSLHPHPTLQTLPTPSPTQKSILRNFLLFSTLFSLNHGSVVSCLSLATARLGGSLGSYQSCVLYGSYTLSALLGATYVVSVMGGAGKGAVVSGMWIYCAYVGCFAIATIMEGDADEGGDDDGGGGDGGSTAREIVILLGGLLGGIGGGFLWTAQGAYFARVSAEYAAASPTDDSTVTTVADAAKELGGKFAAVYLAGELVARLFSTAAIAGLGWSWSTVFLVYFLVAVGSTLLLSTFVTSFPSPSPSSLGEGGGRDVPNGALHKFTSTWRILISDPRMKYMVPLCAVFALAAAFLTSFVNGEVLRSALNDTSSVYVGALGSVTAATAAVGSVVFGRLAQRTGNTAVLAGGCLAFALPSVLFLMRPGLDGWGVWGLVVVYAMQGVGRATFEGNLRAEFAVMFAEEKEGAFGNIVFWNGLVTTIGFVLTAGVRCREEGPYCVRYQDGTLHNVLLYEVLVLVSAVLAVGGLWRVAHLKRVEEERSRQSSFTLDEHLL